MPTTYAFGIGTATMLQLLIGAKKAMNQHKQVLSI